MLVKISCGRCKGPLMLNEDHVGCLVRCPKCKNTFTAKPPELEDEVAQPALDVSDAEPLPAAETSPADRQLEPNPAPRPRPVSQRRHGVRFRFPVRVLEDSSGELGGSVD